MFGQRDQLAGVRNGVARLIHSELMLNDVEAGFGERRRLVEPTTLGADIAVDQTVASMT